MTLSGPSGTSLGSPATATVTITDNESVAGIPTLSTLMLVMLGIALAAVALFKVRLSS